MINVIFFDEKMNEIKGQIKNILLDIKFFYNFLSQDYLNLAKI